MRIEFAGGVVKATVPFTLYWNVILKCQDEVVSAATTCSCPRRCIFRPNSRVVLGAVGAESGAKKGPGRWTPGC